MQCDTISTTLKRGYWPRGGEVEIRDEQVHCPLLLNRQYNLSNWLAYSLHLRFLRSKTDRDLIAFVRAWGPLHIVYGPPDRELERALSIKPVSEYRGFQRWLEAVVRLLASCGEGSKFEGTRECLLELLAAESLHQPFGLFTDGTPWLHALIKLAYCPGSDPREWVAHASEAAVRPVVAFVLENVLREQVHLGVEYRGGEFQIAPRWDHSDLRDALLWMVWQDRLAFCHECGQLFKVTPHRWKYDNEECAHRATDRVWRREKRRAAKEAQRKKDRRRK